jgi:hypothetical protein
VTVQSAHRIRLPLGLTEHAICKAVAYIEQQMAELLAVHRTRIPKLRAIVGICGAKALDSVSNYEKHRHADTAQQRFPDLCRRGCGTADPRHCLESKGSKRPWAVQSHYDHAGWYIVWRYLVDTTESLEVGRPVIVWRVDVVFLQKSDWKYEKSSAGEAGGGRTPTFGVKNAAQKLRACAVYRRKDVVIRDGKPVHRNGG